MKNGSGWIQDYERCENLVIDSVTVISKDYWNNDGIDIVKMYVHHAEGIIFKNFILRFKKMTFGQR